MDVGNILPFNNRLISRMIPISSGFKNRIKDFQGNVISEEIGSLYQGQDGTWWIA